MSAEEDRQRESILSQVREIARKIPGFSRRDLIQTRYSDKERCPIWAVDTIFYEKDKLEHFKELIKDYDTWAEVKINVDIELAKKVLKLSEGDLKEVFKSELKIHNAIQKDFKEEYKRLKVKSPRDSTNEDNLSSKPKITLPKLGKLVSSFAEEVGEVFRKEKKMFYRIDTKEIVEIGEIEEKGVENIVFQGFKPVKPNRFVTLIEQFITPGIEIKDSETEEVIFNKKSMSPSIAQTVLESQILQEALPKINRIFTVPLPILLEGKLTFPMKGYDSRFRSWLLNDAPEILRTDMSLEEGKEIMESLFSEFPFETKEDKTRAIAALITPFLRGLFPRFTVRTPVAAYKANRERAGKDYCAGLTGILYYGDSLEDSPIEDDNELRKKICAGLREGRKRFHFSNNKGHINSPTFEGVITAENWADRILGKSENVTIANEIDFSMSGNVGISFTPDLANRCIFINLFLAMEDANSRRFKNPNLHTWLRGNRGLVLSAIFSLINNWVQKGMVPGSLPFASFPEWARICGGIMEAAGYDNPCIPSKENSILAIDNETMDMKVLFELAHAMSKQPIYQHRGGFLTRGDLIDLARQEDIFGYYNFENRSDQTKFGLKLSKFIGRILSDIKMEVENPKVRASRQRYKFILLNKGGMECGNVGNVGNLFNPGNVP